MKAFDRRDIGYWEEQTLVSMETGKIRPTAFLPLRD
jgi:hypothetical protein